MDEIQCPIRTHAREKPQAPAIMTDDCHYPYETLDEMVSQLECQLMQLRVQSGSKVAFIARTSVETVALFFALFRMKAAACPLSFRLPPAQIDQHLKRLLPTHVLDPHRLCKTGQHRYKSDATWDLKSKATFLFTSGSSGNPKIASHCLNNHFYSALGAIPALNLNKTSRYLLSLPLFHVSGISILFRSILSGSSLIMTDRPLEISLNVHEITHASLVPTQLYRLMQHSDWHPTHLSCALIGGAALSGSLSRQALLRQIPINVTYGMTEMSSMILCGKAESHRPLSGSLMAHREMKTDAAGELLVRGKTLFEGYWNTETQSCELPLNDGWFSTGDLGCRLADGSWILKGRKDRLFISGGENIQPEEIEEALSRIPGILAARVEAVPDPEFGHRPVAYLLEETPKYELETIREHLKESLPSFKHPVQIYPFTNLMLQEMKIKAPLKTAEQEPLLASFDQRTHGQS